MRTIGLLVFLVAAAGCSSDHPTDISDASPSQEDPSFRLNGRCPRCLTAVALLVSPATASLPPQQSIKFAAQAIRSDSSLTSVTVTWSATGGTIDSAGNYTAGTTTGPYKVIAASTSGSLADTAQVVVTTSAPTLTGIVLTPSSVSLALGGTQKFLATGKMSDGTTASVPVTWTETGGTVDSTGLYQAGNTGGSYRVIAKQLNGTLADTSAITITTAPPPPPPPPGGLATCLTQTGPLITLTGLQPNATYYAQSLANDTRVDATAAVWKNTANQAMSLDGGARVCAHGGLIAGSWSPHTAWETMHDTYAVVARLPSLVFENFQIFDYGDGITLDSQDASNWTIRGVHVKYGRDDCVENDFLNSGLIEDSFFECASGLSSREYTTALDGSGNMVTVRGSLWRTVQIDPQGAYRNVEGNLGLFKWSSRGPKLRLYDNVYRADAPATWSDQPLLPPASKLDQCSGNVFVWLGSGPFPEPLPSCFTLMTGQAGLDYWNARVADWKTRHPSTLTDIVNPIIAIRSPTGGTLTGTVTLTATAVDDQDVVGVQFKLNGEAIGAEATTESPVTKFRLSWDSRGKANASYTLTATARDAAGNTKTSAGTTVTISN